MIDNSHETIRDNSYQLTIAMGTLNGLGRNLYSNSAAVLTELIANAWDADATRVVITYNEEEASLTISDNGQGMTHDQLNSRFLTVGYQKRETEGEKTLRFYRDYMGRKGLGKLSVFSLANDLLVASKTADTSTCGFRLNALALEEHIKTEPSQPFKPEALAEKELPEIFDQGTTIVLRDLRKLYDGRTRNAVRTRIARRFDLLRLGAVGDDEGPFVVEIDGKPITVEDRKDLALVEHVWLLGGYELPEGATKAIIHKIEDTELEIEGMSDAKIEGWIGSVKTPQDLNLPDDDESLRNIIVMARKRPIQEGLLDKLNFNQLFGSYVTGQVSADFLDVSDREDIATSDRQRLLENDERVVAFIKEMRKILVSAANEWSVERTKSRKNSFLDESEAVRDWFEGIRDKRDKKVAEKVFSTVAKIEDIDDDTRRSLYRSAILAFEELRQQERLDEIERDNLSPELLFSLLVDHSAYERLRYGKIVRDRLRVIRILEEMIEGRALENRTRDFVADNPWLLNPSWDRATKDLVTEKSFRKLAEKEGVRLGNDMAEGAKRIDLQCVLIGLEYLIVEFKRPGLSVNLDDLSKQVRQYAKLMTRVLRERDQNGATLYPPSLTQQGIDKRVRLAVIVSRIMQDGEELTPMAANQQLEPLNCEVYRFEDMLGRAKRAYEEFDESTDTKLSLALESLNPEWQEGE